MAEDALSTFNDRFRRTGTISAADADGSFGAKPEAHSHSTGPPLCADSRHSGKFVLSRRRGHRGVASAADRGWWSLIDGGEDRVEAAQSLKAGDKRDLGHPQIGTIDLPFGPPCA